MHVLIHSVITSRSDLFSGGASHARAMMSRAPVESLPHTPDLSPLLSKNTTRFARRTPTVSPQAAYSTVWIRSPRILHFANGLEGRRGHCREVLARREHFTCILHDENGPPKTLSEKCQWRRIGKGVSVASRSPPQAENLSHSVIHVTKTQRTGQRTRTNVHVRTYDTR
jgi:hypothetical protein